MAGTLQDKNDQIEVIFRKSSPIDDPEGRYPGFKPGATTLKKGSVQSKGGLALPCDILFERDVAVSLRDGVTIYIDIYRPLGDKKAPAIMGWSPYGKKGGYQHLGQMPGRFGIAKSTLSGLQVWEGPDPAYWCNQGYAVVNPDARGAFNSEGDIHHWGSQEAKDGYDVIEWLATQNWCNGHIGLTGNSWLAIVQWFIAAQRPPHLAAMAPWEGFSDLYRHSIARGGILEPGFNSGILSHLYGNNRTEDTSAMISKYPLMNEYWQDKAADLKKIEIPAYIVASYSNPIHVYGTFYGFEQIASADKWLRIHNTMEWPDYYEPEHVKDLQRFFDRYLKETKNGWEQTPPVRLAVLNLGGVDEVDRAEEDFPPAGTKYQKKYFDARTKTLVSQPLSLESEIRYKADDPKGRADFTLKFDEQTEVIGHLKLRLWVAAEGHNDMDLFVLVQKLNKKGKRLSRMVVKLPNPLMGAGLKLLNKLGIVKIGALFYTGPNGRLRVSHRELDEKRSTPQQPYLTHIRAKPLKQGEIVPVEIALNPIGMRFSAGEQLWVSVAGHDLVGPLLPGVPTAPSISKGEHVIYAGGKYDSHLLIPVSRG
jgi:uncharacterized protein